MPTRSAYDPVDGTVYFEADYDRRGDGWLGYASTQTDQSGITDADLTGLSVTVTVRANRLLRITGYGLFSKAGGAGFVAMRIQEGATILQSAGAEFGATGADFMNPSMLVTPSAGVHTYKLRATSTVGTVSLFHNTGVLNATSFILVEDIGPSS